MLDLSDPVVTLMINDGDEATLELDVLLTWSASDTSGLAAYAISSTKDLGGADWISLSGETSVEEEIQEHTINGPDGLKLVYLGVRDTAGRISTTSDSIWYVTSRPEGTVLLGDGSGWTNTSTIEVRAEHTGGSVATHYKAAFSPSGLEAAGWVPIVTMVMLEPTEPGGVVTVYCLLLGPHNVTSDLLIDSIRQDLLAPNIEIVSPSVDRTENENIKLILSVVDDMDTAPSLDWRINGGDWTPIEGGS
ncbi:MAG: hypothetical protein GWN18_00615, partial [Thermoplasmata archaeon]|nr:hypothetical protein [Thermoplasmata archaeon]NIS10492.1 hypothetical protein [Thermoplasmata archaeon]NIS18458.1 hypothetical protein [Thermoplasmata archaeon]NIU47614.1 hypothetical protein [Thermoplasmata archaeon]NIV77271.1 hypothetical protein [Thermoplasmata archaeon]